MALYNQMISSILCLNCWISEVRLSFQFAQMWWRIGSIISPELAPNGFGPGSNTTFRSSESTTLWSSSWVQGRRMMQTSVTVWEDVCIVIRSIWLSHCLFGCFFGGKFISVRAVRVKSGRMSQFWRTQGSYVFDIGLKGSPWIQLVPWQMKRWNHALWNVGHRILTWSHMVSHMVTLQLGKLERILLIKIMCCFTSAWGEIVLMCHDI